LRVSFKDAAAAEDALGNFQRFSDRGLRLGVEIVRQSPLGGGLEGRAALGEGVDVAVVVGIVERRGQLGQEGLNPDPQLERGLAPAARVEVGAGAQEQRLAGCDPLPAAQHRGHPFLRAQLLLSAPTA
jgi:hypothetical protein